MILRVERSETSENRFSLIVFVILNVISRWAVVIDIYTTDISRVDIIMITTLVTPETMYKRSIISLQFSLCLC